MAADGRTRVRLSVASQFFHNDDADTPVVAGEYSAEDSTSEKVSFPFKVEQPQISSFHDAMVVITTRSELWRFAAIKFGSVVWSDF